MIEHRETLKQSIRNNILPILDEIMTEDIDPAIIPDVIRARLTVAFDKDQRIARVAEISISEQDDFFEVVSTIIPVNTDKPIEI